MLNPSDLQRLVEIITEEVMNAQRRAASAPRSAVATPSSTTAVPIACAGCSTPGRRASACTRPAGPAGTVAGMIDHTLLKPDATRQEIERLCREAAQFHFATVCVNPVWVSFCAGLLRGSGAGVCSVVGFPLGATTADVKHYETRRAIFDGAAEIDMVINIGA
jgi:deoxyribose-phosphate aldolase